MLYEVNIFLTSKIIANFWWKINHIFIRSQTDNGLTRKTYFIFFKQEVLFTFSENPEWNRQYGMHLKLMGVRVEKTDYIDLSILYHHFFFQKTEYIYWQKKTFFFCNQLIHWEDLLLYPIPKFCILEIQTEILNLNSNAAFILKSHQGICADKCQYSELLHNTVLKILLQTNIDWCES